MWSRVRMTTTKTEDFDDWQSRQACALKAFFDAIDARAPAAKALKLDQAICALEREGRMRGFLS